MDSAVAQLLDSAAKLRAENCITRRPMDLSWPHRALEAATLVDLHRPDGDSMATISDARLSSGRAWPPGQATV